LGPLQWKIVKQLTYEIFEFIYSNIFYIIMMTLTISDNEEDVIDGDNDIPHSILKHYR